MGPGLGADDVVVCVGGGWTCFIMGTVAVPAAVAVAPMEGLVDGEVLRKDGLDGFGGGGAVLLSALVLLVTSAVTEG